MLNRRLIVLISIFIGITIMISFVLWIVFKSPSDLEKIAPTDTSSENTTSTPIAPSQEGEFTTFKLSNDAVISPTISNNKVLYYSKITGNLLSTDFEGRSTESITDVSIPNLITTLWSFDKSKAINIYQDGESVSKALFNISKQKAVRLDSRINFITFSPNKDRIAYQFIDKFLGINNISIADPDGLNWRAVQNIRMEDIKLLWPKENTLAIITAPSGTVKGSLLTTNTENGGVLNKIVSESFGLTAKYSPDGNSLLYSQTDQYGHNPSLFIIRNGGITEQLSIGTLSDKCSFSAKNNLYCAVPSEINGSLTLPDDFYKNTAKFSDIFFRVDATGNRSYKIFDPKEFKRDFNASEILISPNEDYIIFINKKDGLLYSVKIK